MNIILLNKKPGITSFDALREIKKELKTGKVGHTGTLDKFAQGLLIVLTGKALKLSKYFLNCDKQYTGKICFGAETDTLDPEGQIIAEAPLPTRDQVESVLQQFTGNIMQTPPAFSALHINGKRASELVREGKTPQMKPRPVTIYKLELKNSESSSQCLSVAEIFVHCSSGTYIRSLARDIALAAGSRGHLVELTRTKIAGFELPMSSEQGTVNNEQVTEVTQSVVPINKDVISKLGFSVIDISLEQAQQVRHGKPIASIFCALRTFGSTSLRGNIISLFQNDKLVAIIEKKDGKWKYGCVFV